MSEQNKGHAFLIKSDEPVDPFISSGQIMNDFLGYDDYAKSLAELALQCETPITIGIHGRWGAGKSSLMKKIEFFLKDEENVRTVWYNPWMYQFEQSPLIPLLHEIRSLEFLTGEKVKRKGKQIFDKLIRSVSLDTALKMTLAGASLTGIIPPFLAPLVGLAGQKTSKDKDKQEVKVETKVGFSSSSKTDDKYFENGTPMQIFAENFQAAIDAVVGDEGRLFVFIDDLDRCMPESVVKLLEVIKLFLNANKCVFFLAIDRNIVESSIATIYKNEKINGRDYLEKIIQLPFDIPPIQEEKMVYYIKSLSTDKDIKSYISILTDGLIKNPRQVKRFMNTFKLRDILGQKSKMIKYDKRILAKILVLQFSFPELYEAVCADPRVFILFQENFNSQAENSLNWGTLDVGNIGSVVEKFKGNATLSSILSREPRIENTGILYEHIYLTRSFARISEIEECDTGRLNFQNSQLSYISVRDRNFSGYNFNGAIFEGAEIYSSSFKGAKLVGANLRKAVLRQVKFSDSDLQSADFRGATFKNTKFLNARIENTNFKGATFDPSTIISLKGALGLSWDEKKFDVEILNKIYKKSS